ncbi:MAG: flavin reductase family protein [Gammaproteobacteria bacterium]|nr:flavin reductase family protein [Gammaproteobacteria bacterium]MYD80517.1 flavin reductase family protein [Gammaproteobacteria bacterium]
MSSSLKFDIDDFRHAVSQYATGIVVVAGVENGSLVGFAAQSFVSLSLDPPLVLFCPQKSSTSWPRIRAGFNYGINILGAEHSDISEAFAVVGAVPDMSWKPSNHSGVPILDESIAFLDCSHLAEHEAGDHTIVVSTVNGVLVRRAHDSPLIYLRGKYGTFVDSN